MQIQEAIGKLIKRLSEESAIQSIAITGKGRPLPAPGEGDIDMFVYCTKVPAAAERKRYYRVLDGEVEELACNAASGGHWGRGDFLMFHGIETWVMYFTMEAAAREAESILSGRYPDRMGCDFYPMARLRMICDFDVLYDDGFLSGLQQKLSHYPEELAQKTVAYHTEALKDDEDLRRAAAKKDVLFYHFALDIALDHFLQALFALNRTYFPSRKRNLVVINGFSIKPEGCEELLEQVLQYGGEAEGIAQSFKIFRQLSEWILRQA